MKWRKFSEKSPKENSWPILRTEKGESLPFQACFSSGYLWFNIPFLQNTYPADMRYYEWLDESDEQKCSECGRIK